MASWFPCAMPAGTGWGGSGVGSRAGDASTRTAGTPVGVFPEPAGFGRKTTLCRAVSPAIPVSSPPCPLDERGRAGGLAGWPWGLVLCPLSPPAGSRLLDSLASRVRRMLSCCTLGPTDANEDESDECPESDAPSAAPSGFEPPDSTERCGGTEPAGKPKLEPGARWCSEFGRDGASAAMPAPCAAPSAMCGAALAPLRPARGSMTPPAGRAAPPAWYKCADGTAR